MPSDALSYASNVASILVCDAVSSVASILCVETICMIIRNTQSRISSLYNQK
jgi:hypothetical protein